ncbi:MAG: hypothetical protein OER74_09870 [Desulfobacteraceae bacterium]|nr:hypothetical protein [Desulfobacteraceae bacterium]
MSYNITCFSKFKAKVLKFKQFKLLSMEKNLHSAHPRTNLGHMKVSNPEMRIFVQGQGNQGIARRRTFARRTSDSAD